MVEINFSRQHTVNTTVVIFLILAAALTRAPGLGKWCLAPDEFYYSEAVASIMEEGVPRQKGGGYYTRGIGLTYLTALSTTAFKDWEVAVRLPVLIAGVLTVPLFYLLCRLFLPAIPALSCSLIILLSSWHIEFSRFARFYVPFQFVFIGFVYLLFSGYFLEKKTNMKAAWILAGVSPFLYEAAIFIPFIFLLMFVHEKETFSKKNCILIFGIVALIVLNVWVQKGLVRNIIEFAYPFVETPNERLPVDYIAKTVNGGLPIILPNASLVKSIGTASTFIVLYTILVLTSLILLLKAIRHRKDFWTILATVILAISPLLHQYAVMAFGLIIISLGRKDVFEKLWASRTIWSIYIAVSLCFWIYLMTQIGAIGPEKNQSLHYLIGFPPIKKAIILPFYEQVPVWGLVVIVPVLLAVASNLFKDGSELSRYLLMTVLLLIFLISAIRTFWHSTRYSFFLFPLVILIGQIEFYRLSQSIQQGAKGWFKPTLAHLIVLVPLIAFLFTEDFNYRHVTNVSSAEYNFRMNRLDRYSRHWYPRVDVAGPAEFVNKAFRRGDIVVLDHVVASRYLNVPFLNYVSQDDHIRFPYHSRMSGTREVWTGRRLVSNKDALFDMVPKDKKNSLWLIAATVPGYIGTSFNRDGHRPEDIAKKYDLELRKVFSSIDGRVAVWQYKIKTT